ncbi:MAG: hypothetical protein M1826_004700 [Phylliscum demangeonii]|nr:MAG: hypothetical protein M1826_004700 [Phylliscum demangeonii]
MASLRHSTGIAQAISHTFLRPTDKPAAVDLSSPWLPLLRPLRTVRRKPPSIFIRPYAFYRPMSQPAAHIGPLRDENVQGSFVHLVDPKDPESRLGPATSLQSILRGLNREEEFLLQVAEPRDDIFAVCKIINKKEAFDAAKARRRTQKAARLVQKEMELNWSIDAHDLAHRMGKLQEMLRKGMRLEILLAAKRRTRKASQAEADAVLLKVRQAVAEVEGAVDWKPQEGLFPKEVRIYVEVLHVADGPFGLATRLSIRRLITVELSSSTPALLLEPGPTRDASAILHPMRSIHSPLHQPGENIPSLKLDVGRIGGFWSNTMLWRPGLKWP